LIPFFLFIAVNEVTPLILALQKRGVPVASHYLLCLKVDTMMVAWLPSISPPSLFSKKCPMRWNLMDDHVFH
jgi:hypothetical protein